MNFGHPVDISDIKKMNEEWQKLPAVSKKGLIAWMRKLSVAFMKTLYLDSFVKIAFDSLVLVVGIT